LLVDANKGTPIRALGGAAPYLRLFGTVLAAWRLLVGAFGPQLPDVHDATVDRCEIAQYFSAFILPETLLLEAQIRQAIDMPPGFPASLDMS
jgi:hypothetical protein